MSKTELMNLSNDILWMDTFAYVGGNTLQQIQNQGGGDYTFDWDFSKCNPVEINIEPELYFEQDNNFGFRVNIPTTIDKIYQCDLCDKKYDKRGSYYMHLKIHSGLKYACSVCQREFTLKSNLMAHFRTHTNEKPFVCALCGKKFNWKTNFATHQRTHTGERPFSCFFCDKTFSQRASLAMHVKSHTDGEKSGYDDKFDGDYDKCVVFNEKHCGANDEKGGSCDEKGGACDEKGGAYGGKSGTVDSDKSGVGAKGGVDYKISANDKAFRCYMCHDTFFTENGLKLHIMAHKEDAAKPFKCALCDGKKFARKSALHSHYYRKHSISKGNDAKDKGVGGECAGKRGKFHCKRCSKTFSRKKQYENHLKARTCKAND